MDGMGLVRSHGARIPVSLLEGKTNRTKNRPCGHAGYGSFLFMPPLRYALLLTVTLFQ